MIRGYEQIPGTDFHESFSPLETDSTIRIVLVIDVEAEFLNFSNILIELEMRQCKTNPCLFIFPISGDP